ncbi:hypothetical protein [Mangrovimonas aestuarii]|uniref:hypothetical protein n=1 Tax=Mangrovimonas aestuarii TaxID=3018443 RepID=UPI0023786089|nr:hypothetical protein [Mangrovimonas aestuarii]
MTKTIKYRFATVIIDEDLVIATMNEGITIVSEHNNELERIANKYFKDKPFVYISNRTNSYSIDPSTYLRTSHIDNLIGFAVVSETQIVLSNTQLEKLFMDKPFQAFTTIEKAKQWAKELLVQHHI